MKKTVRTLIVAELITGVMFERDNFRQILGLTLEIVGIQLDTRVTCSDALRFADVAQRTLTAYNPELAERFISYSQRVTLETYVSIGMELVQAFGDTCEIEIGTPSRLVYSQPAPILRLQ